MKSPRVSVVIPCFNVAETVSETIASVTAQTMADFEIIAVDNNCMDNTVDVLSEISIGEPRLRIIKESVQGLSAARNGGIRAARGEFIALLDADDLWDADYLEKHLTNFDDEKIGISYARVRMIDMESRSTGQVTRPQLSDLTAADLLRSNPCTALLVVRAQVFEDVGFFDEDLRSVEDQEWLFRAAHRGVKLSGIDRVLASYRITPGGLSANLDTMLESHGQLLDAASRIAPSVVAGNRRLASAAMLRYCARRSVEHGKSSDVARRYLAQMLMTAPELLLREPWSTLKVIVRVLWPTMRLPKSRPVQVLQVGDT
ncbi:MAG: glycosyltransferase [Hyphomicrobiaceae bacterium]